VLAQGDYLVIPGERIGSLTLGMSIDDAVRILGKPNDIVGDPNHPEIGKTYFWNDYNIGFSAAPEMTAKSILSSKKQYVTAEGIRVGSSGNDVVRAYGNGYMRMPNSFNREQVFIIYKKLGLQFMISETNNLVLNISVQVPY
jgi:hypothetical protein